MLFGCPDLSKFLCISADVSLGGKSPPSNRHVRVSKDTGIKNPGQIQVQLLTPATSKSETQAYLFVASPFCRKGLVPPLCSRWEELELPRQAVPPAFISAELFCQQRITRAFSSSVGNNYASPMTIDFGHEGEETLQGTAAAPPDTAFPVTGFLLNPN